jgi:hypothetical protein
MLMCGKMTRVRSSGAGKPSFKKPMKFVDSPACDNSPSMLASNIEMQESGEATALLDDLGYLLVGCALPPPPPPPGARRRPSNARPDPRSCRRMAFVRMGGTSRSSA